MKGNRIKYFGLAFLLTICLALLVVRQIDSGNVKTNKDRIEYLNTYGWQVSEEPLATQELLIPEKLDDESYTEYVDFQMKQGFDLKKYAGKRVKRYTYEVLNYPTGEIGVQANLLVYKNTVIGGDVLSPQLNGFLHGLSMP